LIALLLAETWVVAQPYFFIYFFKCVPNGYRWWWGRRKEEGFAWASFIEVLLLLVVSIGKGG